MSHLGPKQVQQFLDQGSLLLPRLFSEPEIDGLTQIVRADQELSEQAYGKRDSTGKETRLAVRNELADSPYAPVVRSQRVAGAMQDLLADEIYHYHHKIMIKEPRVGGAWEWHQDYGYWYQNGCLFPDMASCLIAISPSNRENGCLQIIPGSHRMGRIDHVTVGDQFQTDPVRIEAIRQRCQVDYCEMGPGDALFFHSNLLHRSDANQSGDIRLSLICCYNTRHNDPFVRGGRHPNYSAMEILDDDQVGQVLRGGAALADRLHEQ